MAFNEFGSKKKNWFVKHWIASIIIVLFILGGIASLFDKSSSDLNNLNQSSSEKNKVEVSDNSLSDSFSELKNETINNLQEEPEIKPVEEVKSSEMSLYAKKKLCTELCAGEDINIPVIKNECSSSCLQIYYYTGEEGLDDYIKELQEE